jgi:hypothetical protein
MTTDTLPAALATAPAISLDELDARASLQDRIDGKFLATREAFDEAIRVLVDEHGYEVLEIDGTRAFTYRSVYYDTHDRQSFRAHVQRRRQRFKVRTRHYVESDVQRFELKFKGRRGRTVKHATPFDHEYFQHLPAAATQFFDQSLRRHYQMTVEHPLHAVLFVEYRRATLVAPDGGERVTFDWGLHVRNANERTARLRDDFALVEVKSPRERGLATRVLRSLGCRSISFSKFAAGIALTEEAATSNDLLWILRRAFEPNAHTITPETRTRGLAR